jgi:hypothetical protein
MGDVCVKECPRKLKCTYGHNKTFCTSCTYWKKYEESLFTCELGVMGEPSNGGMVVDMSEDICPILACPGYVKNTKSEFH